MKTAYTLAEVRAARVVIVCERCNRRGEYSTARLIAKYGADYGMPSLKWELVQCQENSATTLRGCVARYSDETKASWL